MNVCCTLYVQHIVHSTLYSVKYTGGWVTRQILVLTQPYFVACELVIKRQETKDKNMEKDNNTKRQKD